MCSSNASWTCEKAVRALSECETAAPLSLSWKTSEKGKSLSNEFYTDTSITKGVPLLQPSGQTLYADLVGPTVLASEASILFSWMPKIKGWERQELAERTTRCLPAVRPGQDLVALPDLQEVRELWSCWASAHALSSWQVIWFNPQIDTCGEVCGDAPALALLEVLQSLPRIPEPSERLCLYPMYVTSEVEQLSQRFGMHLIGDRAHHTLCPLPCAKGWLHPHINPQCRGPSLHDLKQSCRSGARGPTGYIASSTAELVQAFHALQEETPQGTRFVLKPSWTSGGDGIILDVSEAQLQDFEFPAEVDCTVILEELIETERGKGNNQSPTLYMLGAKPCGPLADQLLAEGGAVNLGNRWPSELPDEIASACTELAQAIHSAWDLQSQWGLDFVLDRTGLPIVVDLNMGRPNGNFAIRLWESRFAQQLFLHTATWRVPEGIHADEVFTKLRLADLAWDQETLSGVIMYQLLPGLDSSYTVASASGWDLVDQMVAKLEELLGTFEN
eukprot:gnl/MRDRNA2_/MRDRNA2_84880_c0_seq1.p1 gnl/MRDRNA2_/MRDRNA2_84880_c0~~gnl/MRDRNA2_/MRDRNA2_84880_c0_seq1.p1  ORF type:complete len:503 (-),score=102.03 gnl/MRDRNA2_/MRDRNA2_84880_c0_seq1:384-1892(-)